MIASAFFDHFHKPLHHCRVIVLSLIHIFIQAGMCDEVSVVIAATADGSPTTQTLFMARKDLSDETPVRFDLQSTEVKDGGSVWLRYQVRTAK